MSAVAVLAHGTTPDPAAPEILAVLATAAVGAAYGRGVHELWARRGRDAVIPVARVAAFVAGLAVVLATALPPVHDIAEHSFAGHMTQHMLLLTVAGPLLAAGGAGLPLMLALPRAARTVLLRVRTAALLRWLRRPTTLALMAAGAHTVVLWFWHLPGPYVAALTRPDVHVTEHLMFIGVAWLLWAPVVGPARHRPSPPVGFLLLFVAAMGASALGAVLTLAPGPLYPAQALAPTGGDPLTDQQLAGLVMWVPMDALVLLVSVVMFRRWLANLDRAAPAGHDLRPDPAPATEVSA